MDPAHTLMHNQQWTNIALKDLSCQPCRHDTLSSFDKHTHTHTQPARDTQNQHGHLYTSVRINTCVTGTKHWAHTDALQCKQLVMGSNGKHKHITLPTQTTWK